MTDTANADSTQTSPVETDADITAADGAVDAPGDGETPEQQVNGRDDVKWRARYRQAETLLTVEQARTADLAERITTMQRQQVERLAAIALEDPTDLWRDGTSLADLLGHDGHVDADKVADAAQQTVEAHKHWRRAKPVVGAPASAVTSDGRIPSSTTTPTWAEVLRGNRIG